MQLTNKLTVILSTILGLAMSPVSPSPSRKTAVGVGVHHWDQQSVAQIRDLGVRHVRSTLYWSLWEDSTYQREWVQGLDQALRAGLQPLVVVHQAPFGDFRQRELVYRSFAEFMKERAAQFPAVRAWQLWNEMDVTFTDLFGAGHPEIPMRQRGQMYADMLRLAYPAIKEGNPSALVVTGGIASAVDGGFLDGLHDGNAQYDVLAIHTYGFPLVDAFEARGLVARSIMRSHGDDRPLWNTEFGLERMVIPGESTLTPAQVDTVQLEAWRTSIEANEQLHIYDRIYGHVLTEGRDLGFDLVRSDGSKRPTYKWLKSWMHYR